MTAIRLVMLIAVLLCWVKETPGETELPPAAKEGLRQFDDETIEAAKKMEIKVQKHREKSAVELKKLQDIFCKEIKLDEAVAIRDLIRSMLNGTQEPLAGDLPAAAREVYKQHEQDVAEIEKTFETAFQKRRAKKLVELKNAQDQFCREAKLDEAVACRDLIHVIRARATPLTDPGNVNHLAPDIGKVFYYQVTGVTTDQSIYGTDIYTNGSHLGMASVHCGLLKNGQTGIVKVTVLPAENNYAATTRHGVTSIAYGGCGSSFKVERVYGYIGKAQAKPMPDRKP